MFDFIIVQEIKEKFLSNYIRHAQFFPRYETYIANPTSYTSVY